MNPKRKIFHVRGLGGGKFQNQKTLTSNLPTLLNGLRSTNERAATGELPILLNVD
jgi:hypothetical protein